MPGPDDVMSSGFFLEPAMWNDLWAALALLMVIEGIAPFVSPGAVRRMMATMAQMDDRSLRMAGLVSMIGGVALLYWVR
jgi:uncharacterized protein YjeT (DUF2065 family)